jgi:hypothetical protein
MEIEMKKTIFTLFVFIMFITSCATTNSNRYLTLDQAIENASNSIGGVSKYCNNSVKVV